MKTWLSFSSGKDSIYTLMQLQQQGVDVCGLLVSINQKYNRVAMHGTHFELLQAQAKQLALPLYPIYLADPCDEKTYQQAMQAMLKQAQQQGVKQIAFGDLFLESVRAYRETQLASTPIKPIFPLWQQATNRLAHTILAAGVKAIITCVDSKQLSGKFVGREFDTQFLADLPPGVDPCGENGEFHTFVYASPLFKQTIPIKVQGQHRTGQFVFAGIQLSQ